jgi:hypothetical protein
MHTQHCTLSTAHSTLHTQHCTLNTAKSTPHTQHCTLNTAHSTLHTQHCTLNTAHSTPHRCRTALRTAYRAPQAAPRPFTVTLSRAYHLRAPAAAGRGGGGGANGGGGDTGGAEPDQPYVIVTALEHAPDPEAEAAGALGWLGEGRQREERVGLEGRQLFALRCPPAQGGGRAPEWQQQVRAESRRERASRGQEQ